MTIELSSIQAARAVGVSARQVNYWAKTGLVKPSTQSGKGRGLRRRYTFRDLVALKTVAELRTLKCPLSIIRRAVAVLRQQYRSESDNETLAVHTLLTDGRRVFWATSDQVVDVLTKQSVWPVHMGLVLSDLKQRMANLPLKWTEHVTVRGQKYRLVVHRDVAEGGYWVQGVELPGALEQGETAEEAVAAGRDAIESLLNVEERLGLRRAGKRHVKAG